MCVASDLDGVSPYFRFIDEWFVVVDSFSFVVSVEQFDDGVTTNNKLGEVTINRVTTRYV